MATSEFRYNKKRKHYAYIYKSKGDERYNLLLSSKSVRTIKKKNKTKIIKNYKLTRNPNPNKLNETQYIMKQRYIDDENDFNRKLSTWSFDTNDKRMIKRLKTGKKV